MAELDKNRATFVRKEYRDYIAQDLTVLNDFPAARSITLQTNLNGTDALALANKILADGKKPKLVFEVTFEGTMELDSLVGKNPMAIATFPRLVVDQRLCRVVAVDTDYDANTTTVQVRG